MQRLPGLTEFETARLRAEIVQVLNVKLNSFGVGDATARATANEVIQKVDKHLHRAAKLASRKIEDETEQS